MQLEKSEETYHISKIRPLE